MTKLQGSHIWYELITAAPDAAVAFYGAVVGWTAQSAGQDGRDYRILSAGDGSIGGLMPTPAGASMPPVWLGYIGVDDVDSSVTDITAAGGAVHMPATDIPGVGRIAMVADPQGAMFYVMRPAADGTSTAFSPTQTGHCSWNELSTSDQPAALAFYQRQFGWTQGDAMDMGPMGEYRFINHDGGGIGAVMPGTPSHWTYYFRVDDINSAAARIGANGGTVSDGPSAVPTGDFIVHAIDPQGASFALVGKRKAA